MTRRRTHHHRYWACALALALLLFLLSERRANTYRRVIYLYEGMAKSSNEPEMRTEIERYIGRPNCDVYRLPIRPRYKHFWDDYNTEMHNWSE